MEGLICWLDLSSCNGGEKEEWNYVRKTLSSSFRRSLIWYFAAESSAAEIQFSFSFFLSFIFRIIKKSRLVTTFFFMAFCPFSSPLCSLLSDLIFTSTNLFLFSLPEQPATARERVHSARNRKEISFDSNFCSLRAATRDESKLSR